MCINRVLSHTRFIDFKEIMSFSHWLTVAMLSLLSFTSMAQQNFRMPDPSDADAPVPEVAYTSTFKNYQSATDENESPDKIWRASNDAVGNAGMHAGQKHGASVSPAAPITDIPHTHGVAPTGKGN